MSDQPVNPAQHQPVPDPIQPKPEQVPVVEDNERDVPTVSAVDFENLPKDPNQTNTPILEPVQDESAAQPQELAPNQVQASSPQQVVPSVPAPATSDKRTDVLHLPAEDYDKNN